jgi:hypothetical protein
MSNIVDITKPFSVTRRHPSGAATTINALNSADYARTVRLADAAAQTLDVADAASVADSEWFAARPKRKARVRPALQDEFFETPLPTGWPMAVVLHPLVRGVRVRFQLMPLDAAHLLALSKRERDRKLVVLAEELLYLPKELVKNWRQKNGRMG